MKTISLWQPWASLIVLGHKKIETRGWNTKYRGPLLIHAAKKWNSELETIATGFHTQLKDSRIYHCDRGAIIGMVKLIEVATSEQCRLFFHDWKMEAESFASKSLINAYNGLCIDSDEEAFGDYSSGRFGWLLSDPILFKEPIPAKGMQGFWNPDASTMAIVAEELKKRH